MQNYRLDSLRGEGGGLDNKGFHMSSHTQNIVITSHPATQQQGYHYRWMHHFSQFKILFQSKNIRGLKLSFLRNFFAFLRNCFYFNGFCKTCMPRNHKPHAHTVFYLLNKHQNHHQKPHPRVLTECCLVMAGAKVGGHDICALVYFHSIVFCLDFHQGERYLRKRGRNWDENKGRGREPSVMEPVPHWCSFSQRHVDMAPPLLLMCLLIHWVLFRYSGISN